MSFALDEGMIHQFWSQGYIAMRERMLEKAKGNVPLTAKYNTQIAILRQVQALAATRKEKQPLDPAVRAEIIRKLEEGGVNAEKPPENAYRLTPTPKP